MATTSFSNNPQVFGLVNIIAAVSGPASEATTAGSTVPSSRTGTGLTIKWMSAAVAGLVPCAESGTKTTLRVAASPLAAIAALIAIIPHNSPCAPAFGESATASIPVNSINQCESVCMTSNAPCTVETGCSGCTSLKPGMRAIFSFNRGLCFIVHEPKGNRPVSMP